MAEFAETAMYLYRATKDVYWLEVGRDIVESIDYISKVPCGYATVKLIFFQLSTRCIKMYGCGPR